MFSSNGTDSYVFRVVKTESGQAAQNVPCLLLEGLGAPPHKMEKRLFMVARSKIREKYPHFTARRRNDIFEGIKFYPWA